MKDLNKVILQGRLTKDAEIRYANSGTAIVTFSICVNRSKKTGDSWADEPNFFDVTQFGRLGESIVPYLTKGRKVTVDGELVQDTWAAQDGTQRHKVKVISGMIFLGEAPKGQQQPGGEWDHDVYEGRAQSRPSTSPGHSEPFTDDEIVF